MDRKLGKLFVSFPQKRNKNSGIRVNYLHSGVKWPIEIEFVIENVNIVEVEKQTCEHTIFKYRKKIHAPNIKGKRKYHKWEVLTT